MSEQNPGRRSKFSRWIGWSCLLIAADQVLKAVVRTALLPGSRMALIDGILFIHFVPNYRGFSWFVPDLPGWCHPVFLALRLLILAMAFPVYDFYSHNKPASRWAWIALVLISAGIAGNLLDGLFTPYTTDFIQVFQSPSANFADLYAYAGVAALAIEIAIHLKQQKPGWRGFRNWLSQRDHTRRDFFDFVRGYFR
jgi:lipoprotein signal peptidase